MNARYCTYLVGLAVLLLGLVVAAPAARADLAAVGPVDPVTGFPFWYQDDAGLRLQLCDEGGTAPEQPPCLPELNDPDGGFVAGNIGEALYYAAVAEFTGPNGEAILAQCVLEAAGPALPGEVDTVGNAALIRLRNLSVAGSYTIETPCGTFGPITLAGTEIRDEIAVVGDGADAPPFAGALPGPVQIFASNGTGAPGFLGDGISVGPLSGPLRPGGVTAVTVSGAISATSNQFVVIGKVSGCSDLNEAPTAVADLAVTATGRAVTIDVLANDSDLVVVTTGGGETTEVISPPLGSVLIVPGTPDAFTPAGSATAVANADGTITLTPAANYTGSITFSYQVMDRCGLLSNPALVTVVVEDLRVTAADYRARTGRWTISGSSSELLDLEAQPNVVILRSGSATGPVIGAAAVQADGGWSFVGKASASLGPAPHRVHATSGLGVTMTEPLQLR